MRIRDSRRLGTMMVPCEDGSGENEMVYLFLHDPCSPYRTVCRKSYVDVGKTTTHMPSSSQWYPAQADDFLTHSVASVHANEECVSTDLVSLSDFKVKVLGMVAPPTVADTAQAEPSAIVTPAVSAASEPQAPASSSLQEILSAAGSQAPPTFVPRGIAFQKASSKSLEPAAVVTPSKEQQPRLVTSPLTEPGDSVSQAGGDNQGNSTIGGAGDDALLNPTLKWIKKLDCVEAQTSTDSTLGNRKFHAKEHLSKTHPSDIDNNNDARELKSQLRLYECALAINPRHADRLSGMEMAALINELATADVKINDKVMAAYTQKAVKDWAVHFHMDD